MGYRIKKIRERLEEMKNDKELLGLEERRDDGPNVDRQRETHSFIAASKVIGRNDDKEKIMDLLIDDVDIFL